MSATMVRFSPRQRVEHATVMVLFILLALTGLSQKFYPAGWAQWVIALFGGIDRMRWVHRASGVAFTAAAILHFGFALYLVLAGKAALTIVPTRKDFTDAVQTLRYYLGLSEEHAKFDRFDYRQKFEYWGLVFGALIEIATGFILLYPALAARFMPGEVIPASKVAHGAEGLMAFLVVIIWHVYNAHLAPGIFPFDRSIFTGRISRERMEEEHPLEYERLVAAEKPPEKQP
jgi:cytochrome b subunit of formate dehydrogenase